MQAAHNDLPKDIASFLPHLNPQEAEAARLILERDSQIAALPDLLSQLQHQIPIDKRLLPTLLEIPRTGQGRSGDSGVTGYIRGQETRLEYFFEVLAKPEEHPRVRVLNTLDELHEEQWRWRPATEPDQCDPAIQRNFPVLLSLMTREDDAELSSKAENIIKRSGSRSHDNIVKALSQDQLSVLQASIPTRSHSQTHSTSSVI